MKNGKTDQDIGHTNKLYCKNRTNKGKNKYKILNSWAFAELKKVKSLYWRAPSTLRGFIWELFCWENGKNKDKNKLYKEFVIT